MPLLLFLPSLSVISCVCPLEFVALMVWWVYDSVTEGGAQWYSFTRDSITTAAAQVTYSAAHPAAHTHTYVRTLEQQSNAVALYSEKPYPTFDHLCSLLTSLYAVECIVEIDCDGLELFSAIWVQGQWLSYE